MKSTINTSKNFNSNTQSKTNLIDAEFYSEHQTLTSSINLYHKHHDEPDFDCEFLHGISHSKENENTIDSEIDEDFADLYNDNQWDVDVYDPYLESTYF